MPDHAGARSTAQARRRMEARKKRWKLGRREGRMEGRRKEKEEEPGRRQEGTGGY